MSTPHLFQSGEPHSRTHLPSTALSGRQILCAAVFATIAATLLAGWVAVAQAASDGKPSGYNVLFLMTDEQHHRSLSLTGNRYITTPNMDRIGREGALFLNATCVTPFCSPSRASFITGLYPHRHRILTNVDGRHQGQQPLNQNAFPNTETTLHRAGYATAHRGKWHLGDTGDFDCYESRTYLGKTNPEYGRFLEERLPAAKFANHPSPGKYLNRPVEMIPAIEKAYREFGKGAKNRIAYIGIIGRSVIPPELLPETRMTDEAIQLIEKHARERFMITVSWSPPHDLWVIPEPYYSMVDRKKIALLGTRTLPDWDARGPSKRLGDLAGDEGLREYAAIYHGMVKYIDDQVGRILKKLDELGLAEKTLVIFTTDHGDMVGAHGCIGKSIAGFYDDLVRIPFLMRLPGVIKPGTVVRQPVSQIDVMPTILDYIGQSIPERLHGQSLRPLIEGRDVPWRDYAFCQRADHQRMIRIDHYKYVFGPKPKMVALYDLQADPDENKNLADAPQHANLVRQMHRRLLDVMKADGDPFVEKLPDDPLKQP
ncbi:MAG: sulfatase-like hydrolase/transferase [Verrucomicrobiia bacterium]|jgi:arylsulfatase A-like enzyme